MVAGSGPCHLAVCMNVHCLMNGAEELVEHLEHRYGLFPGEENDLGIELEVTYCFGACDLGPNVELDGVVYDGVSTDELDRIVTAAASRTGQSETTDRPVGESIEEER